MNDAASTTRKWLTRYAFGLACSIASLVSIILIGFDDKLTWRVFASSAGLNLLASIIFAIIFTVLSTKVQERNMLTSIQVEFSHLTDKMQRSLQATSALYLPSKVYESSNAPLQSFNHDLRKSLQGTSFYGFRGASAKFVRERIEKSSSKPQLVRIVIIDPSKESIVRRRAADRQQHPFGNSAIDVAMSDLRDEIYMSLVALFDIRHLCSIEVVLGEDTAVTRLEIFDDVAYISWYQAPGSEPQPFPETMRFEQGSFLYQSERMQLARRFEGNNVIRFRGSDTDDVISTFLTELSKTTIDENRLGELRKKYQNFIDPYRKVIQTS
ncbi:hypothetical protein [Umezawaea tangerina]|uniref:Uncharacterized protein n=1 Tax=Umezawaea tangerina TaxID=84725 RepID=A0A2T0TLR8_9PSEU|nr:hypothetical protein [Umezawaea tangerina]PRY46603.1 hypothetical protein CLV43_101881 [Umezawaea tangerina]